MAVNGFDHKTTVGLAEPPMPQSYKAPPGDLDNPPSTIGPQINTYYWYRRALVEAAKEAYFGQMADVRSMPKNMGKTIKQYQYLPILDDRNINDQGIDAQGRSTADLVSATAGTFTAVVRLTAPTAGYGRDFYAEFLENTADKGDWWEQGQPRPTNVSGAHPLYEHVDLPPVLYFSGAAKIGGKDAQGGDINDADAALAEAARIALGKAKDWLANNHLGTATEGDVDADDWKYKFLLADGSWGTETQAKAQATGGFVTGNLYGSARDVGSIMAKMPVLSETGGRVNRVGMTRRMIQGSLEKFGFFEEYTQEALDFDTDSELLGHITSEAVKAANQITEDTLQIDLLHSAGVVRYCGSAGAVSTKTVDGVPSYDDFVKLSIELDNNRVPKNTRIISGSRMIDTRVVNAARYAYVGSELLPSLMRIKDYHDEAAWIPAAQYAQAGTLAKGEVGAIGDFRFIVVPDMMYFDGAGAVVADFNEDGTKGSAAGKGHGDGTNLNVYPILVIGDGAFTTIGFQTDGKTVKFKITHKKPGPEVADRHDPYGEVGFYSIKWYYGYMPLRPERIALMKCAAAL